MEIWISGGIIALVMIYYTLLTLPSASMVLMSGHAFGRETSRKKLHELMRNFIFGHIFALWLVILAASFLIQNYLMYDKIHFNSSYWLGICIVLLLQILFMTYFAFVKKETHAWITKPIQEYMFKRSTKTRSNPEALSLGIMSVIFQLFITGSSIFIFCSIMLDRYAAYIIPMIILYTLIVSIPLFLIYSSQKIRNNIIKTHKFFVREHNFLQLASILCLATLIAMIFFNLSGAV